MTKKICRMDARESVTERGNGCEKIKLAIEEKKEQEKWNEK